MALTPTRLRNSAGTAVPVLAVGFAIALFAGMERVRRVDNVEVFGVALFVVVLLGSVAGVRAGVLTAMVATIAYALARRNAVELAGSDMVNRMIGARAVGYLAFGLSSGWLISTLKTTLLRSRPLAKPQLLGDALAKEITRARRYDHPLAVVTIDLTRDGSTLLPRIDDALRTSDLAAAVEGTLTIMLPETDAEGAQNVVRRLEASLGLTDAEVVTLQHEPGRLDEIVAQLTRGS